MGQKKRKKRSRAGRENPAVQHIQTGSLRPEAAARQPKITFVWGLAAGFLAALAVTVASDLGWIPLGEWTQPPAGATPAISHPSTRSLVLDGTIPAGGVLLADGVPVAHEAHDSWTVVQIPVDAKTLEVRGSRGTWWTTPITAATPDTLRPAWTGEIVVEGGGTAAGATLLVDGRAVGTVPGSADGLAPGWHVVTVRAGDRLIYEEARAVEPGALVTLDLPAAPPRGTARLVVRSRRLDANGVVETKARPVRLDGQRAGATPLELTVEAGYHSIAVGEPGRPARVTVVRVDAGSTRYVDMESSDDVFPELEFGTPTRASEGGAVMVPVRVIRSEAPLRGAVLHLERAHQRETVDLPLVALPNDPELWIGAVPANLAGRGPLRGFVSGTDILGRSGWSELASLSP